MSTGADLRYIEKKPGEWYYAYQCWPYGETDEYDVIGPFPSHEKAEEHCDDNYPNAGGSWIEHFDGKERKLPGKPTKPRRRRRSFF